MIQGILGQPNRSRPEFDSFFDHGVGIGYGPNQVAKEIQATQFISGPPCSWKILGIGIGDRLSDCVAVWGSSYRGSQVPDYDDFRVLYWELSSHRIAVEMWSKTANDPEFGSYTKDTVKRISVIEK